MEEIAQNDFEECLIRIGGCSCFLEDKYMINYWNRKNYIQIDMLFY